MTALLEFKQKIKGLFAQYEVYVMPLLKFILALVYFIWINSNIPQHRSQVRNCAWSKLKRWGLNR